VALTWAEARILCDIDDAIADAVPSPEWIDLYVKAMANVALTMSGYDIPTREMALAQSAALEAGGSGVGLMRSQLMASTYGNVIAAYRLQRSRLPSRCETMPTPCARLRGGSGRGRCSATATGRTPPPPRMTKRAPATSSAMHRPGPTVRAACASPNLPTS
jgi:hypothetical protein